MCDFNHHLLFHRSMEDESNNQALYYFHVFILKSHSNWWRIENLNLDQCFQELGLDWLIQETYLFFKFIWTFTEEAGTYYLTTLLIDVAYNSLFSSIVKCLKAWCQIIPTCNHGIYDHLRLFEASWVFNGKFVLYSCFRRCRHLNILLLIYLYHGNFP